MADKLEKRLKNENMLDAYNEQFRQYIEREVFVEIPESEKSSYKVIMVFQTTLLQHR